MMNDEIITAKVVFSQLTRFIWQHVRECVPARVPVYPCRDRVVAKRAPRDDEPRSRYEIAVSPKLILKKLFPLFFELHVPYPPVPGRGRYTKGMRPFRLLLQADRGKLPCPSSAQKTEDRLP